MFKRGSGESLFSKRGRRSKVQSRNVGLRIGGAIISLIFGVLFVLVPLYVVNFSFIIPYNVSDVPVAKCLSQKCYVNPALSAVDFLFFNNYEAYYSFIKFPIWYKAIPAIHRNVYCMQLGQQTFNVHSICLWIPLGRQIVKSGKNCIIQFNLETNKMECI